MQSKQKSKDSMRGFSLVEAMVALAAGLLVTGGALVLMNSAMGVSDIVGQRAEMQQNARVALNLIASDLSQAGTGMPNGGLALPTNERGRNRSTVRGCGLDESCGSDRDWIYEGQKLFSVTPGEGLGQVVDPDVGGTGEPTDIVTLVYRDRALRLDEYPLVDITTSGSQIDVDLRSPVNVPGEGVLRGDVLVLSNANGNAAAVVTNLAADVQNRVVFSASDVLNFNQPSASHGNIASLQNRDGNGRPDGTYPPTRAFRIFVVTYFIDSATYPERPRLMRQIGGHAAETLAEYVTDLQFTYDIFDPENSTASAGLTNVAADAALIQKVNVALTARSPGTSRMDKREQFVTLTTSVSGRNLSFKDRYQ
ncbi:MAG TPA: prepilin-type N-terminal cleavage/methylation domain-containing protein [Acidobacteriota bacterium]|nr:prepilin-type N-terminal cleavage/methylation domain-containing protein [Acidobacteriota bacterium]